MAAISVVQTIQAATSTNATSHATAVLTPGATGNFLLLTCHHSNLTSATPMATPTGTSFDNPQFIQSIAIDATRRMDIWVGRTSASASAVTFNFNETSDATVWSVVEFANVDMNRGVNNTIPGLAANIPQNNGIGTAASMTMRPVQHASNALIAIYYDNAIGIGNNPEAGWTELSNNSTGNPTIGLTVDWRIGTDITPTSSYASSVTWGALGLELWGEDGSGEWFSPETFTKANGPEWGPDQEWVNVGTGVATTNNEEASTSTIATAYAHGILANDSSSANHEARVSARIMVLSGSSVVGLKLRGHSTSLDCFEFLRVGATTLSQFSVVLRRRNGAVTTYLGGTPTVRARASLTTSEDLYMTVVGNTITCYVDGVQVAAATDATLPGRNRGGLMVGSGLAANDTHADNFAFGDIGKTRPPVIFAGTTATSSSAKAAPGVRKARVGKSATANQAIAVLSSRVARMRARLGQATSARGTGFATQVEGFTVQRPIIGKSGPSFSAKASLTTGNKIFNTKISQTFDGGGIFNPAILDVVKGQVGSELPLVFSATGTLIRDVGAAGNAFQSDGITAHFSGGLTQLAGTASDATSIFAYLPSRVTYIVRIPTVAFVKGTYWETPEGIGGVFTPPYYLEGHTTLVQRQYADKLFRHYRARPEGHNVYIYSDGTVSESDPDSYSTMWRESDRTQQTLPNAATVVRIFWGGHEGEQVTPQEAALLRAAGYTVRGFRTNVTLAATIEFTTSLGGDFANV